jgi:hypothetical protein
MPKVSLFIQPTIDVAGSWEIVPSGTQGPDIARNLYVTARIAHDGIGITGLKQSDFHVFKTGFAFTSVDFAPSSQWTTSPFQEEKSLLSGTYTLMLTPPVQSIGQFSFALSVSANTSIGKEPASVSGQALFTVVKVG